MQTYKFSYTVSSPEHLIGKTFYYTLDALSEEEAVKLFKGYISRCRDYDKEKIILKDYNISLED